MELKLKSCPFCGGEAELCTGQTGDGKPWPYVECIACAGMAEPNIWNNRAASPPEAAGRGDGWIDVKQELPPFPTGTDFPSIYVLTAKPTLNGGWIVSECKYGAWLGAKRESGRQPRFENCGRIYEGVTHWQPLPAPPSGEQSQPAVTPYNAGCAARGHVWGNYDAGLRMACIVCGQPQLEQSQPAVNQGKASELARTDAVNEGEKNVESTASGVVPFDTSTAGGTRSPLADEVAPGPQEGREP